MSAGNQSGVKAIFSRCLLSCPSVNLWRSYLTFIKTVGRQLPEHCLEQRQMTYSHRH